MSDPSEIAKFIAGFRGLAKITSPIGSTLISEFREAERMRQNIEQRWLMDLRQYRGIYEPEVAARLVNRSRSFAKRTRSKVRALDDRVFDLEFPAGAVRNFKIAPTPEPMISAAQKAKITAALTKHLQAEPSAEQLRTAVMTFATSAAERMASTIDDQLIQASYRVAAKRAIHDGNLYGTGIIKGPLVDIRQRHRFVHDGKAWVCEEQEEYLPYIDHVQLWRFFPDLTATDIKHCRYTWERHRLTKAAVLKLADNPSFDADAIRRYAMTSQSTTRQSYEVEVRTLGLNLDSTNDGSFELLERWGWIDTDDLKGRIKGAGEGLIFANAWLTPQGEVVKFAPQPIKGVLFPYHFYYFDRDETSLFGEGIATIMRDEQDAMNASKRATFDNLAITAGPQFEVNATMLDLHSSPTEMGPFSIWWRTTKDGGQFPAIRSINAESHVSELMAVSAQCDKEIDEVTGIPKYLSGDAPTGGAGATASGLAMMLAQANMSVKAQVQSYDDGITTPLMQSSVAWNMQFNPDPSIKGDYDVVATGVQSLVAKEVRTQTIATFGAMLTDAQWQYIKLDRLTKEQAAAHELGDIVKTQDEVEQELNSPAAKMQQQLIQAQSQLALAQMEATVGKLQAEIAKIGAEKARLEAMAIKDRAESAYSALQAGGVAAMNQAAAIAGDEILRSSGWQDATPDQGFIPPEDQMVSPNPPPKIGPTPGTGERAGIETPAIEPVGGMQ